MLYRVDKGRIIRKLRAYRVAADDFEAAAAEADRVRVGVTYLPATRPARPGFWKGRPVRQFLNNFFSLPKAEKKLAADLFDAYDNALELLDHMQVILDDAANHSDWFSDDEAVRQSDGGLVPHLSTT